MEDVELIKLLTEIEQRSKSNCHRLDKAETKLADNEKMLASLSSMAQRQDNMDGDIKEIKADVKTLTSKPAKRWESVIEKVILAVVAAVVGVALAHLGLG